MIGTLFKPPLLAGQVLDGQITAASENPLALAHLASLLVSQGDRARAATLAQQALEAAPTDTRVQMLALETLRQDVPAWHFDMLCDQARNRAYDAALRRGVTLGCRVLDIGTGTGLLAMMAARAGAREVIACEMNPVIAELAERIIALNGYADRIRVIPKCSSDLDLADVGGRVDVIVSEIISDNLVSEGVLGVVEDAAARLLRPGGRIIPARGEVRVALAHHPQKFPPRVGSVEGFDLTPFNRLAHSTHGVRVNDSLLSIGSEAASLFDFDFQSGGPFRSGASVVALEADGGSVNGVIQWFRLQLDRDGVYENIPGPSAQSSWRALFYAFEHSIDLQRGAPVAVHGDRHRDLLRIWCEG